MALLREREEQVRRLGFAYGWGDGGNAIFRLFYANYINRIHDGRARHGMITRTGLRIAVDMLHVEQNSTVANGLLAKQLRLLVAANRAAPDPAEVVFTNCCFDQPLFRDVFARHVLLLDGKERSGVEKPLSFQATERSVSRVWQEEAQAGNVVVINKLAERVLDGPLSPDTVYVIPAILGKGYDASSEDREAVLRKELVRARKNGFQSMQLPVNRYLSWTAGSKSVPHNNVAAILRHVHRYGHKAWEDALKRYIPRRKWDSDYSQHSRDAFRKRVGEQRMQDAWILHQVSQA